MSVALENIFNEPLADVPSPQRRTASPPGNRIASDDEDEALRPTKRRRSSLFFDDPDELENAHEPHAQPNGVTANGTTEPARPDVDSLFEDLDEAVPPPVTSKPFDLNALRRQTEARVAKEAPSSTFTKYAVQSSSPPREGLSETTTTAKGVQGKGGEEKTKRPIAKLDETRLLGKDGLPALVQLCRDFKPKGKGHEVQDLNRLFSVYQFWAHKMYPKTQFIDTVSRVERLCHQKRMQVALGVWRDEVNGTINGLKPEDNDDRNMDSDKNDESGDEGERDGSAPRLDNASSRASSEAIDAPPTRPPSSASEHDLPTDDDFDIDALLAEQEEMERSAARPPAGASTNQVKTKQGSSSTMDFAFDEDEDALWAMLHDDGSAQDAPPAPPAPPRTDPEQASSSTAPSATSSATQPATTTNPGSRVPAVSRSASEPEADEEMWSILEDIEADQLADAKRADAASIEAVGATSARVGETQGAKSGADGTGPPAPSGLSARAEPEQASSSADLSNGNEDWEDMYVDD